MIQENFHRIYTLESQQKNKKNSTSNFVLIIATQLLVLVILMGVALRFVVQPPRITQVISPVSQVLGIDTSDQTTTQPDIITILTHLTSPSPTPTQKDQPRTTKKPEYTIAVIGDSMEDTMGEYTDYLEHELKRIYPKTIFHLFNYGKGSQTVSESLAQVDREFHNQTRNYPALTSIKPDIIICGSFAYNPFTPYDRNHHWIELTHMIQKLQTISTNVYLLAEIAPLRNQFGTGNQGVNWETATAYTHSGHIIEQLQNAEGLSKTLNVPLIDMFNETYDAVRREGNAAYIDPADHIHPSVYGHEKTAEKIVEVVKLD